MCVSSSYESYTLRCPWGRVFSDWGGCSRVERGGTGSRDGLVTPQRDRTVMGRPIRGLEIT
eukprot:2890669-Rhodomonas_salina.1